MLNAEDTKERIRKLRLKVVSGPTDPTIEASFKENTVESNKIITEWKDVTGSENVEQNISAQMGGASTFRNWHLGPWTSHGP